MSGPRPVVHSPVAPPLDEFFSGGYIVAQPFTPPSGSSPRFFSPDIFPGPIVSAGECYAEILPSEWLFESGYIRQMPLTREDRAGTASTWEIPLDSIDTLLAWGNEQRQQGRILFDDAFTDVDVAREFLRRFVPRSKDVRILGLGLHRASVAKFLQDVEEEGGVTPGWVGSPNGVRDGIARRIPMAVGGRLLGFEVLDVALGESRHSWHCHGLEREMRERFGLTLLSGGLIAEHDLAQRVAECLDSEEVGCEPGVWRAWAVVEYPRDAR